MWVDITMIRSTECYILQGRLGGGGEGGGYGYALLTII